MITIPVAYQISQASIFERIVAMQDTVETDYHADIAAGLSPAEARAEAVAWMQSRVDIEEAYVSPDESSLWAIYSSGFEAALLLPDASSGPVYGGGPLQRVDRCTSRVFIGLHSDRNPVRSQRPDQISPISAARRSPICGS